MYVYIPESVSGSYRRVFKSNIWGEPDKILLLLPLQAFVDAQKMKFSIKDFFKSTGKCADLVTYTEEILNGKLHFLCSVR